jgi:hypothetical protein
MRHGRQREYGKKPCQRLKEAPLLPCKYRG